MNEKRGRDGRGRIGERAGIPPVRSKLTFKCEWWTVSKVSRNIDADDLQETRGAVESLGSSHPEEREARRRVP